MFHQFVVDMYTKIENKRLLYIRLNQKDFSAEQYIHFKDPVMNDGEVQAMGQMVILPFRFTGGPRYMHERKQESLSCG